MTTHKERRRLTEAEIEVWLAVAQTVSPRSGAILPERKAAPPVAPPAPPAEPEPRFRPPFLPPYSPPAQRRAAPAPPLAPFEKRYRQKVTHGRVDIDGAIDLHGLTQPEAHDALRGFVRAAQARGARLLLVVTGKGRSRLSPGRLETESGVLRRAVPLWLRADDLRPVVLGFEEAGLPHGGHGALYVRLRRG